MILADLFYSEVERHHEVCCFIHFYCFSCVLGFFTNTMCVCVSVDKLWVRTVTGMNGQCNYKGWFNFFYTGQKNLAAAALFFIANQNRLICYCITKWRRSLFCFLIPFTLPNWTCSRVDSRGASASTFLLPSTHNQQVKKDDLIVVLRHVSCRDARRHRHPTVWDSGKGKDKQPPPSEPTSGAFTARLQRIQSRRGTTRWIRIKRDPVWPEGGANLLFVVLLEESFVFETKCSVG